MARKRYNKYNPLFIFDKSLLGLKQGEKYHQTTLEEAILLHQEMLQEWELRHSKLRCCYMTKSTQAGRMLEVQIYPSFFDRKDYSRALQAERTAAAQKRQNDKNSQRKLIRLIQANFLPGDIAFTGGFSPDRMPATLKECKHFVKKYFDTLKYSSKRAGAGPVKYIYVIETNTAPNGVTKYHVHMIMSQNAGANTHGIPARDWIEDKWKGGEYENTKSLKWKQDRGGFTGIAKYITKQFEGLHETERPGLRRWGQSLGLKQWDKPPAKSHSRFKKRKVVELIRKPATMKAEFEKAFPGYEYLECHPCEVRLSDATDGIYLYCRMYRRE